MPAPAALRPNYSDLFGADMLPVLEELFMSTYEQSPLVRDRVMKVVSTDRDIWQASELHDLPLYQEIAEGTEYTYTAPNQGSSKTLTVAKFGSGFSISREAVSDGKFDLIGDMTRKLAESGRESQEIQGMDLFNSGFGSQTTSDGVSIFNSSHLLPSGLTFRNTPSTDADLSESSLQTAMSDFATIFVGDSGIIKSIKPRILLVHPTNYRYALELVGSDGKPDTGDNNMNSLRQDGLTVIQSARLTDTDAWFVLASPDQTGLRCVVRDALQTQAGNEAVGFHTDSIYYKASYREKIGATHPYGVYGVTGA